MTKRAIRNLLLALASWLVSEMAVATEYPRNPLHQGDSIYVSHQGVYRFDTAAVDPVWSSLQGVETFAPVVHDNLLLVGSTQGLYALNLADGKIAWRIEKRHSLFTPSIAGLAFAGSVHGELYAIRLDDGSIDWRRTFDGWVYSPAINADASLLWTGGQAHAVYALAGQNGKLLREIPTSQETVFGAVDLGRAQVAFNLFDGSTVIVDSSNRQIKAILPGVSQPTGIGHQGEVIFRSHSDGSLATFTRGDMAAEWRHKLTPQNLTLHPALPGYLLLGDGDRKLILLDLATKKIICELDAEGQRLLPIQLDTNEIIYFRKSVQPTGLKLVKFPAFCI